MARRRARSSRRIEQHLQGSEGGYEIVGEVKGAEMLGWRYDGPFDELPRAAAPRSGFPRTTWPTGSEAKRQLAPRKTAAASPSRHRRRQRRRPRRRHRHRPHRPRLRRGRLSASARQNGLPPVAPLDDDGVFLGLRPAHRQVRRRPGDRGRRSSSNLKRKDRLFAVEDVRPHSYPHCWRLQDGTALPPGRRVVHQHELARGDHERRASRSASCPKSINGQARELDWLRNMGDWMISKKRFWGLALPIWVDDDDPSDFEVIGSRGVEGARRRGLGASSTGHTPHRPWIDKVKITQSEDRQPDVRASRTWATRGSTPASCRSRR